MDAMTLVAKLTLNDSEFRSGLKESEKYAEGGQKGLNKWGVMFGNLWTKGVTMAVRAVKNFGQSVITTGMDFDEAMSTVAAVSGLTDDEFETVRQKAIDLGRTTKFTSKEVAEGFYYMGIAGWDAEQMLAGIEGVLNLAAASGEDLGSVSDIVTDAMTAFGLTTDMTADDVQHFVDVLAAASANSNTTVHMMGEAFKYAGTMSGMLGYSIDDVAVALGLMANTGIKASQAGTTLRRILSNLIKPSDDAAAAMEAIGLSLFEDKSGAVKPFMQVMKEMRQIYQESPFDLKGNEENMQKYLELADRVEAWVAVGEMSDKDAEALLMAEGAKLTTPGFIKALAAIGGARGLPGLLAIMNASEEDFEQLTESVANSEGSAQKMADTMLDNLKGDITLLNSALDGLKILLSDSFKADLRSFMQMLTEEVGALAEAFEEGGLAGMFTNLADWIVNGITGALSDDSVTVDAANDFGKAIGDFVGHLVARLIENAPEIISGLFEAGLNLAGGLIEGLFAGLFGTGEGTVYGLLTKAEDERNDTIAEANATAAEAQGIVSYMQTLVDKYGEAAQESGEWADALARLRELVPGITEDVKKEGEALGATTQAYREYIEQQRLKAIQDAKDAYVGKIRDEYKEKQVALGEAQVNENIAKYQQEEALKAIAANYLTHFKYLGKDFMPGNIVQSMGLDSVEKIMNAINQGNLDITEFLKIAESFAQFGELGEEDYTTFTALKKSYEEGVKAQEENATKIAELTTSVGTLQQQLIVAEAAAQRMAEEMAGFTVPEFFDHEHGGIGHAKGLWSVPYDDYPAALHRGEMVLTASQARRYREGGMQTGDMSAVISDAVKAAVGQMAIILNDKAVGRTVGDSVSSRVGTNLAAQNRRVNYGYGS